MSNNIDTYNSLMIKRDAIPEMIEKLARAYREQKDKYVLITKNSDEEAIMIMFNMPRV